MNDRRGEMGIERRNGEERRNREERTGEH